MLDRCKRGKVTTRDAHLQMLLARVRQAEWLPRCATCKANRGQDSARIASMPAPVSQAAGRLLELDASSNLDRKERECAADPSCVRETGHAFRAPGGQGSPSRSARA